MNTRNIRTFFKHLAQNKLYTSITIVGFSVSLMFVILLSVYIEKEYSYDQFHANKDRIYRLVHEEYSGFAPPTGALLMDKFPEMESFTRTFKREGFASVKADEKLKMSYLMVDSTFFKMFSFPMIIGSPETVLLEKNSVVLSKSYALRLFGEIPEPGKIIKLDGRLECKLGGVMEDLPVNTHFEQVDVLINFPFLSVMWGNDRVLKTYNNNSFGLYVMEKKNTQLASKAPEILALFKEVNWLYKRAYAKEVIFEPLTDVYFSKSYSQGIQRNNMRLVNVLSVIVVMILFLSILNYINLTIAQSGTRSKEIAIKKLMGSQRSRILMQYTFESILIALFSYLVALMLCFLVEPIFNSLVNTKLELSGAMNLSFFTLTIVAAIGIGAFSGIIPALTISKFEPVEVVKGAFRMKSKVSYSRALIVFQYLIIVVLIISALFINKQTTYMRNFDLGYKKENVLSIRNTIGNNERQAFRSLLETIPGVNQICYVAGSPVDGGNNNSFDYEGKSMSFQAFQVDTSFFRMMDMDVQLTGTALSKNAILVNETALKELGLPDDVTSFKIYGEEVPVYGIVKDFHFKNLKEPIGPAYFQLMQPNRYAWSILVKISDKNTFETVDWIKTAYADFTHGLPITMSFMDDTVNQWYEQEEKVGKIVKYFTILTILISVMGLFAMSLYYVQQKTKEIGIRKVNGAKIHEILSMLNESFIAWVSIAYILACPLAYYAMSKWLENFAYKTTLSWWIFGIAGIVALGIALITVSWQSWRAASRNPIEALRYE